MSVEPSENLPRFRMKRNTHLGLASSPSIQSLGSIHMENGQMIQLINKMDPIGQRENFLRVERH